MRILWADDQPEVVKTLRPLLSPLKAQIVEARDGNEALRLATDSDFDLILLDLHMPPDEWGGLWLLEQLAEAGMSVPILVLSGEGQQRETIKALRLGIEDYVRKEEVERELIPRIQEVMARDRERLEPELLKAAPALVAVPLKRYVAEASAATKLHRLLELYEAILRLAAFLALAEHRVAAQGQDRDLQNAAHYRLGVAVSPGTRQSTHRPCC